MRSTLGDLYKRVVGTADEAVERLIKIINVDIVPRNVSRLNGILHSPIDEYI